MIYSKEHTLSHCVSKAYASCLEDFNELLLREDNKLNVTPDIFENTTPVLDLDCVERTLAYTENRLRNKTMDCTFAIGNDFGLQMLLVELRLNYVNPNNLDKTELTDKVFGSLNILGNSEKVSYLYIFIFQPNIVQQARNRLHRMIPKIPSNYVAMDIHRLKKTYFFPHKPQQ